LFLNCLFAYVYEEHALPVHALAICGTRATVVARTTASLYVILKSPLIGDTSAPSIIGRAAGTAGSSLGSEAAADSVLRRAKEDPLKYPWLTQLLARRPFKVVAVALANKMARIAWALLAHGGTYQAPVLAEAA
jgi:hypothetical protein